MPNFIVEKRLELCLSRRDLARRSGLADETVARVESGRPYRPVTLARIAYALGMTPRELLDRMAER